MTEADTYIKDRNTYKQEGNDSHEIEKYGKRKIYVKGDGAMKDRETE